MTHPTQDLPNSSKELRDVLVEMVGEPCKTKDTEDFPELKDGNGRCLNCRVWEAYASHQAAIEREARLDELEIMFGGEVLGGSGAAIIPADVVVDRFKTLTPNVKEKSDV